MARDWRAERLADIEEQVAQDQQSRFVPMPVEYYAEFLCEEIGELRNVWGKAVWRKKQLDVQQCADELADCVIYALLVASITGTPVSLTPVVLAAVHASVVKDSGRSASPESYSYALRLKLRKKSNDVERIATGRKGGSLKVSLGRLIALLLLSAEYLGFDGIEATRQKILSNRLRAAQGHFGAVQRTVEP